jgi:transposase
MKDALLQHLQQAYAKGQLRLIKRIHALLFIIDGKSPEEAADILGLSRSSVYNYLKVFLLKRMNSLKYKRPPGRPSKLTKTQRKELCQLIDDGPEAAGYDCGCWNTVLIQDLILRKFRVTYSSHYVAELLKNLGYSYQKARFVSNHIDDVAPEQKEWIETWPEIMRLADEKDAMVLFGDEASFAQWGSLSYTWSRRGEQPTVKTSGKRKAYKIMGFIDYLSGAFFYKAHTGQFNSAIYEKFLTEILAKTSKHLIIIQDGARYHTSKAMRKFFEKQAARVTVYQLPRYSPEFNPIEFLWRNIKKQATHLRYFPKFEDLTKKVDEKLAYFANLPKSILGLMGRYYETLGTETA